MTRNLKALGLALVAALALGAIGAQVASAADEHEFHSDGERTVITGKQVGAHTFQVGGAGTVECTEAKFESTEVGIEVTPTTYKTDEITVTPKYNNCSFGGQPATVFFNDCAYVFDSDTTLGNPTGGGNKHANVTIECSGGNKVQVHTVNCTITVGPQVVEHAVRYVNDPLDDSAIEIIATAHGIEVNKERSTAAQPANGCLLFPTGAVGKYTGTATAECRDDEDEEVQANPTTPGPTKDAATTECEVTDI